MSLSTRSDAPNTASDSPDTSATRPQPPLYSPEQLQTESAPGNEPVTPSKKHVAPFAAPKHIGVDIDPKTKLPRFLDDGLGEDLPESAKTFHVVVTVPRNGKTRFFKHNTPGSVMSELEAVAWSFYHLIAPRYVPPKANAHFNREGEYIGISLEAIPGFKSTIEEGGALTEEDLKNPEIVKGLAVNLAMSYFFEEDDLHRGNMSKNGCRIDFDMSLWPIFGHFKEGSKIDWMYRPYDQKGFTITAKDIDNFPELIDAKPFYWPTKPPMAIVETARKALSGYVPISKNGFPTDDNKLFISLKNNETFIYHKFKTLLKCMLVSEQDYQHLIAQHLRENLRHTDPQIPEKNISDLLLKHIEMRKRDLRNVLINMPSFHNFLWKNGKKAMLEIMEEFREHNKSVRNSETKKWMKDPSRATDPLFDGLINLVNIKHAYSSIFRDAKDIAIHYGVTQKPK